MAAGGIFTPAAFAFLRDLAANNEKSWFEANRTTFESAVKQPMAALVEAVTAELARRELPLEGDRKRSSFRIHRDVRFSKDKRPYKTEIGTVWYRQGSGKDGAGVLYFHLAEGGCFAGAAFYHPEPEVLDSIRERIRVHPDRFLSMQTKLTEAGLSFVPMNQLSRMPKGFEDLKSSEIAPALRLRNFLVRRGADGQTGDRRRAGPCHRRFGRRRFAPAALRLGRGGRGAIGLTSVPLPPPLQHTNDRYRALSRQLDHSDGKHGPEPYGQIGDVRPGNGRHRVFSPEEGMPAAVPRTRSRMTSVSDASPSRPTCECTNRTRSGGNSTSNLMAMGHFRDRSGAIPAPRVSSGKAVVDLTRSMLNRELTFLIGTAAISRL